jgi:hypothetical protein
LKCPTGKRIGPVRESVLSNWQFTGRNPKPDPGTTAERFCEMRWDEMG